MTESLPLLVRGMTDDQIETAVATYRDILRENRAKLGCDAVRQILSHGDYMTEQLAVLQKRVTAIQSLIVRRVWVNRNRTPEEALAALKAAGFLLFLNAEVIRTMPRGTGEVADIFFFKNNTHLNDEDLDRAYEFRILEAHDPYSLMAANEADRSLSDAYPSATHWKDANGEWCYFMIRKWLGERRVYVGRHLRDWHDRWYFAGRRTQAIEF